MSDLERLQADLSDLDPEQEAALRAALAADDALAAALVADRHTDGLLRALAAEAASGSAFVDQVAARLEAEADGAAFVAGVEARLTKAPQRRAARARASGSSAWLPALLAASLLLVGGLLLAVARRPGPTESAQRGEAATPTPRASVPAPSPRPRATPAPTIDPQPTTSPSESSSPTPTPERTPTPTPTTAPTPPPTPEPRPTPTTQPSPTPSASPAPAPRRLDVQVAGRLRWLDGKRWRKVEADRLAWKTGQVVQASAHVLLTLPDGTTAALKKSSRVRLVGHAPVTLQLEQGQVYCRVQRGPAPRRAGTMAAAARFTVRTAEGQVDVTGTEFGVARRGSRTTVAVDAGQVVCTNPRGRVVLSAGSGARFTRSTLPKAIRLAVAPLFAWRARLAPPTRVVFAFDFENGLPGPWDVGRVRRGPPRGNNRGCLETVAKSDGATIHLAIPAEQQVRPTERVLRFRVFARSPKLAIQFKNEAYGDNCKHFVQDLPVGRWERLELPLSSFATLRSSASPAQPIRPGQRLTYLQLRVLDGPPEPSYFDAIELVEVLPR